MWYLIYTNGLNSDNLVCFWNKKVMSLESKSEQMPDGVNKADEKMNRMFAMRRF